MNGQEYHDRAQSVVSSSVSMMAIGLPFRGFASISGTADVGYTKKFAGTKKDAVRTDTGVLYSGVETSLVNDSGHPRELSHTDFKTYKKWYDKASDDQRVS